MTSRLDLIKMEIKQNVKLSNLIMRLTHLEIKHGYMICPFHRDITPSMSINDIKGLYHCFGCGAGGDVFSFVMQYKGLHFKDALIFLDNEYNLGLLHQRITAHAMIAGIKKDKERERIAKHYQMLDELENELCIDFRIANFAVHFLKPLSDLWGYFINQQVLLEYQLDLIDQERRDSYE